MKSVITVRELENLLLQNGLAKYIYPAPKKQCSIEFNFEDNLNPNGIKDAEGYISADELYFDRTVHTQFIYIPFKVSVTQLQMTDKKRKFELEVKLFDNSNEAALVGMYNETLEISLKRVFSISYEEFNLDKSNIQSSYPFLKPEYVMLINGVKTAIKESLMDKNISLVKSTCNILDANKFPVVRTLASKVPYSDGTKVTDIDIVIKSNENDMPHIFINGNISSDKIPYTELPLNIVLKYNKDYNSYEYITFIEANQIKGIDNKGSQIIDKRYSNRFIMALFKNDMNVRDSEIINCILGEPPIYNSINKAMISKIKNYKSIFGNNINIPPTFYSNKQLVTESMAKTITEFLSK